MSKPTIFISHITEEKEIAKAIKEFLERKFLSTINVFASSHEESIKLGDDWLGTIKQSMKECKLIIIICSPISIVRPWINFEAGSGWVRDIPVIPLCHSGLTPGKLPVPINSFQGGLLNNQDDIKKLFNRIAEILISDTPEPDDKDFFNAINQFESEVKNTSLIHDTTFIFNLLFRQIELLKYCIYASTLDYSSLNNIDLRGNNIKDHKYTFNDTYNLFNTALLTGIPHSKVYEIYHKTVHQLADNCKFILSYSNIGISTGIRELLNLLLFSVIKVDDWLDPISLLDKQETNVVRDMSINLIKDEPLPPTRKLSHIINYFIDYFESLNFIHTWLIKYESEINDILKI